MRNILTTTVAALLVAMPAWAHDTGHSHEHNHGHSAPAAASAAVDAHTQEDIARHQGMAKAHQQAAQCLAEGRKHDDCMQALRTDCKGLALGKSCGLRHAH